MVNYNVVYRDKPIELFSSYRLTDNVHVFYTKSLKNAAFLQEELGVSSVTLKY